MTDQQILDILKKHNATVEICKMCDGYGYYTAPDQDPDGNITPQQVQCEVCWTLGVYCISTLPPAPVPITNPDDLPF